MRKTTIILIVFSATCGVLQAATVTYNSTAFITPYPLDLDYDTDVLFPKFDTSLGTLTAASIQFDDSGSVSLGFYNGTEEDYEEEVSASIASTVSITGTFVGRSVYAVSEDDSSSQTFDGVSIADPPSIYLFGWNTTRTHNVNNADLSSLTGSGTAALSLNIDATTTSNYTTGLPEGISAHAYSQGCIMNASITYTYNVPEPATMALLVLGGLAMIRRRRAA